MLPDHEIEAEVFKGRLVIQPYAPSMLQPCSYDCSIAQTIAIPPLAHMLASTQEWIRLPDDISASVEGKSTWGRMGLMVHITAGHVDPGFDGNITLELLNVSNVTLHIRRGEPICQLVFTRTDSPVRTPYNGRYQGSVGVIPALPPKKQEGGEEMTKEIT